MRNSWAFDSPLERDDHRVSRRNVSVRRIVTVNGIYSSPPHRTHPAFESFRSDRTGWSSFRPRYHCGSRSWSEHLLEEENAVEIIECGFYSLEVRQVESLPLIVEAKRSAGNGNSSLVYCVMRAMLVPKEDDVQEITTGRSEGLFVVSSLSIDDAGRENVESMRDSLDSRSSSMVIRSKLMN